MMILQISNEEHENMIIWLCLVLNFFKFKFKVQGFLEPNRVQFDWIQLDFLDTFSQRRRWLHFRCWARQTRTKRKEALFRHFELDSIVRPESHIHLDRRLAHEEWKCKLDHPDKRLDETFCLWTAYEELKVDNLSGNEVKLEILLLRMEFQSDLNTKIKPLLVNNFAYCNKLMKVRLATCL